MTENTILPLPNVLGILNACPGRFVVLLPDSPRFTIVVASDAFLLATFVQRKEVMGRSIFEVMSANTKITDTSILTNLMKSLAQVLEKKVPNYLPGHQSIDLATGRNGGLTKVWKLFNKPVLNAEGSVQYIIHSIEDVTAASNNLQNVNEEHRRLQDAQAIGRIGSFEWNYGEEFVEWSDEMYRINGLEPQSERISIDRTNKFVHPEDYARVQQLKEASFTTPGAYELRHRIVLDDHTMKWVMHRFESITDETGDIVRVHGTLQDITEIVKVEQQVKAGKDLLQKVIDAPNIGLAVYKAVRDDKGRIFDFVHEFINRTTLNALGQDFTGRLLSEHGENGISQLPRFIEALQKGKTTNYIKHANFDGDLHWVAFSNSPMDDDRIVHTWEDITESKQAEAEMLRMKDELAQRATDKYLSLFNSIDQGFAIIEVLFDGINNPIDYRFLETNPAFEKQTGFHNVIGKCVRELIPGHDAYWYKSFGKVAQTGEPLRFENKSAKTNKWYDVYAFRIDTPQKHHVAVLFNDISERRIREENIAFVAEVSQYLVGLTSIGQTMTTLGEKIGLYFKASHCAFFEFNEALDGGVCEYEWHKAGVLSLVGSYRLSDFYDNKLLETLRAGKPFVVRDRDADLRVNAENLSRLNIGSYIVIPIASGSKLQFALTVYDSVARDWEAADVQLMGELTATIWTRLEQARAEEALRISENRLQRMVNVPKVGVISFNYQGIMLHVNDAFLQMVRYTREEFESQKFSWQHFTPAEYVEVSMQIMEQLRKTGKGGPYEKEYFRKDGSRIWLMFVAADLDDGTIGEYAIDISDRKRAEEALQQFNEKLESQIKERTGDLQKKLTLLQQAEDLAGMGSWDYDLATTSFNWSSGMYKLFEIPEGSQVVPEIYIRFAVEDDRHIAEKLVKNIRRGAFDFDETIRLNVAGTIKIVKIKANTVNDVDGSPSTVVGVDLDITAVRESEYTLAEQAHFIQSTNEALPDILFVLDLRTRKMIYCNHSFEEKVGYTEAQRASIARPLFDIIYHEDKAGMELHMEEMKTIPDGEVLEFEYRLVGPDGNLCWFSDRNAVFRRDPDGNATEKIGIAQDITKRKNAERELRETNVSLRYANENLQQFASIASHDLQEPLRKLRLFASVLTRYNEQMPGEAIELIDKIGRISERMRQLITEVLQYSKVAYGKKEFVPTNLHHILQKVLGDLDLMLGETGAVIRYDEPLPEIEALPPQMNQLFYNLLINSIKYRKDGEKPIVSILYRILTSPEVKKHPELDAGKPHIEIKFSDNGVGFDQAYAKQIFQIFERLYSVDEFEGTGVGLALCKKIVENHSGHIYAISAVGKGASFHVLLPARMSDEIE